MFARIGSRWMIGLLVGMAWLGSYNGCDMGTMYGQFGSMMGGVTGYYDNAYVADNQVYYPVDPGLGGYVYDPYVGQCCDSYGYGY